MRSPTRPTHPDDFELTPALEAELDGLAIAARAGDAAARNALYERLRFKIERFTWLQRRTITWLEPDELASEAFLVLADLIGSWPGQHFGRYFLVAFPLRLHGALTQSRHWPLVEPQALPDDEETEPLEPADDDRHLALALQIVELESVLTLEERALLRRRLRDGVSLPVLAGELNIALRTLQRRWQAIVSSLRLAERLD